MLVNGNTSGKRSMTQSYDWYIVFCYLALVVFGWFNIYACVQGADGGSILDWNLQSCKQLVWIATSVILGATILFLLPSRLWEGFAVPMYVIVCVLLVVVIFVGAGDIKGSHSWFKFGSVSFQPAEISKITTSLMLAYVMSRNEFRMNNPRHFIGICALIMVPMAIIVAESETGSALVYCGFIFMLYREGLSGWIIVMGGMAIVLAVVFLMFSTFTAVLILLGVVLLCVAFEDERPGRFFMIHLPLLILLGFAPAIHDRITAENVEDVDPEAIVEAMGSENVDGLAISPTLADLDTAAEIASEDTESKESIVVDIIRKIKPLYVLFAVVAAIFPIMLVQGYKKRKTFLLVAAGSLAAGILFIFSVDVFFNKVLKPYQRERIEILLGIVEDNSDKGYNLRQSMIAIGSGGFWGKGFTNGTQTAYGFVPEQHTDFIFCTVGEEWGFAGCFALISIYIFLIFRIIHDAERSREHFTRIYGYCVACCLLMHLFINIGMTIGLVPIIGIPLPLMSYGGSSLWAFTALIFIFLALDHEEKKYF